MSLALRLTVLRGLAGGGTRALVLEPGAAVRFGRSRDNDVVLEAEGVSKVHCKVELFAPPGPEPDLLVTGAAAVAGGAEARWRASRTWAARTAPRSTASASRALRP